MPNKMILTLCAAAAALTFLATTARASCGSSDHSAVTPDTSAQCTPGVRNPAITQANIHSTICVSGFTATERNTTQATKEAVYQKYNVVNRAVGEYEIDHLISLEIGGADDILNLWPQSYQKVPGAHQKDAVENALHRAICCDAMTLADAQNAIVSNWLGYYTKLQDKSWTPCPTTAKHPTPRSRVTTSKIESEPTNKQVEERVSDAPGTGDSKETSKTPTEQ